jgi:hypothetical protein
MPFDLNNIFNQINDKFDEYINKLIELKNKFKILISEKFEIIDSVFSENEKKVLETQNKILSMINNQQSQYFEKMNICLERTSWWLRSWKRLPAEMFTSLESRNGLITRLVRYITQDGTTFRLVSFL